ncbi:hypothetical protein VNO78_01191 [Psophocarpus tetragonolobus]|uniref:Uncharacterized protein n=1 Tax=Psophocarpus tetragonolobus TaxID=3891 RepID=A0AAN9SY38_PSOTE
MGDRGEGGLVRIVCPSDEYSDIPSLYTFVEKLANPIKVPSSRWVSSHSYSFFGCLDETGFSRLSIVRTFAVALLINSQALVPLHDTYLSFHINWVSYKHMESDMGWPRVTGDFNILLCNEILMAEVALTAGK